MSNKIITSRELQEIISKNLRDESEITRAERKAFYIGAGKLLTAVKVDIDAANIMGKKLFNRTIEFLEDNE